mmetsp:Transcript_11160/g.28589  ORF Transcript_11160/g.28589 Transcript_11160/m.28589 type:complete len:121 (+) Transcript_11160:158-520(+)
MSRPLLEKRVAVVFHAAHQTGAPGTTGRRKLEAIASAAAAAAEVEVPIEVRVAVVGAAAAVAARRADRTAPTGGMPLAQAQEATGTDPVEPAPVAHDENEGPLREVPPPQAPKAIGEAAL